MGEWVSVYICVWGLVGRAFLCFSFFWLGAFCVRWKNCLKEGDCLVVCKDKRHVIGNAQCHDWTGLGKRSGMGSQLHAGVNDVANWKFPYMLIFSHRIPLLRFNLHFPLVPRRLTGGSLCEKIDEKHKHRCNNRISEYSTNLKIYWCSSSINKVFLLQPRKRVKVWNNGHIYSPKQKQKLKDDSRGEKSDGSNRSWRNGLCLMDLVKEMRKRGTSSSSWDRMEETMNSTRSCSS